MGLDAALRNKFFGDAGGDATGSFGEDAFGLGEEFDGIDDLRIGDVFGPAAGFPDLLDGVRAVGGIANGEGARNGAGLLRLEALEIAFDAIGDGRAAGGLGAEKFNGLGFHPAEGDKFTKRFGNFGDERAAGHGDNDVVGERPAQLLGDFVAVRLGAFGIVRAKIDVDESPLEAIGDLGAEAVDVVVVAVDAHDARTVDSGV